MKNRDAFSSYHPLVNFLFFALVLVFTMCFLHPVSLLVTTTGALAYAVSLNGGKAVRFSLKFLLPVMLFAVILNPVFNHQGETVLAHFPTGSPLTLESVLYGLAAAVLLAAIMLWFSCYNEVMTSDKFVYLFGRVIPALSLVLSMTLRFVPKFTAQLHVVSEAQRCVGRDVTQGSVHQRVRHAVTILSIMVTWSLENAIETADSMRSRGYGLPGRSAFSIYRFDARDRAALGWLAAVGAYIVVVWLCGGFGFRYFPAVGPAAWDVWSVSGQLAYLALCLTPVYLNGREDRAWTRLQSEI